jgi:hypothetical protein
MVLIAQRLFTDTTPNGIINTRLVLAFVRLTEHTSLSDKQKTAFLETLMMLARKVLAVWTHYHRFRKRQEALLPDIQVVDHDSPPSEVSFGYDQELFMEFDEFLVQYKSSLDCLAKIPAPLLGKNKWNPRSFGEKGQRLVRMLKSAIPRSEQHTIPAFEKLIFEKHKEDLEMIIEARDRVNHYIEGGLDYRNFSVFGQKRSGIITLRVPMWSADQSIVDMMQITFGNLISLCENFIVFFLGYFESRDWCLFTNLYLPRVRIVRFP